MPMLTLSIILTITLFIFVFIKERKIYKYRKIYLKEFNLPEKLAPSLLYCVAKRLTDIIISLIVCLTIIPVLYVILGTIIKLTSTGPIIFSQKRIGLFGKEFTCYKFRSMYLNSSKVIAEKNDVRITPVGKFIRRTHLDEFPQFFNVLLGDMSLVGPRPSIDYIIEELAQYPNYNLRPMIRPGLSGLAQINSGRTLSRKRFLEFDIEYINNQSWWTDFKIILQTLKFADESY